MNTLIYYAFNLLILSIVVLIIGMIKPKWILLWVEKPTRIPVIMIASVIFMGSAVLFGEGNKELQQEKLKAERTVQMTAQPTNAVPAPTPVPVPIPKQADSENKTAKK